MPPIVTAFALATAQITGTAPTVDTILAGNHAAVGQAPAEGTMRLEYRLEESGLTGPRIDRVDLATGAFVETEQAGPIGDGNGYDGRTPWQRDFSGAYTPQEGGDRIPAAVSAAYRFGNLWWRSDRGGAAITYAGREVVGNRALDHLVVSPKGGKKFDAWFDADTRLLVKTAQDQQFMHVVEDYSDFRRDDGLMLAHKVVHDAGLGEAAIARATLLAVHIGPADPITSYSCPSAPPSGATILNGAASSTVPFRLLNNHVYVQARVNGKGPYTFIVDTGGHTVLSPRLVAEVGLRPVGEAVTSGAGDGSAATGFVHFDEIAIGDVRLRDEVGFSTIVYDKAVEGVPVDGMVGFELIRRMVTQIDYGRRSITFYDPAQFKARNLGAAAPFVFYDHLPDVKGSIGGSPARFDIDTGSRVELDITKSFVDAHQLRSRYPNGVSAVTGWGVGGPGRAYMVRIPEIKLGPVVVNDMAAGLSEAKGGAFSDSNYDGNIGSALLKRFVVTFDYAHQVMYLKRIEPTPEDVGTFDRSGMWINATSQGYAVVDVAANSAAAKAGIVNGDVITAINGAPAREEDLGDARLILRARPAGTKLNLSVKRGAEVRSVELTLKDQI